MNFNGKALPLADRDVAIIAGYLGVHIAAVRAVLAIEAAGKGFDASRRPKMLFEPHIFWRELGAGGKRTRAAKEGLAYAKWKAGAYPKDSYPRLLAAMAIDETAALRSASWGLGQVMGFNHRAAGFATVGAMVEAMTHSEGAQLYAMARFMVENGLQKRLRALDWAGFAKGYNGAAYAKHGYHTKLATAYAKRPASEKVTPAPATGAQLDALIGASPSAPAAPKPVPAPPPKVPGPNVPLPPVSDRPTYENGSSGGFWVWLLSFFRKDTPVAKKQAFVGEMIVGSIVKDVVGQVLDKVAKSPSISLDKKDVSVVTEIVTKAVEEQVMPEVDAQVAHQTNTEAAWWQKRSRWAAIVGMVFTVAAPLAARYGLDLGDEEQKLVIDAVTALGGVWAAYLAYRAGVATKPLGE